MDRKNRGKEVKGKKEKDKPKCKIYIFCEGSTEEIYLKHFENRIYNVEIISVDTEHTDALGIVQFAKQYIKENSLNLELGDRGYCVFDADPESNTDINRVFNLLRGVKEKGLDCIFSNPSFEVWFVMHFGNVPYGLDAKKMKQKVKKLLENKYPSYSETTDIYDYLLDRQLDALKRAKILHRNQEKVHKTVYSQECNPFTNIHLFIDYMQEIKFRNHLLIQ